MKKVYYSGDQACENCGEYEHDFSRTISYEVFIDEVGEIKSTNRYYEKSIKLTCAHCGLPIKKSLLQEVDEL
jgi:ssDNA-binding Zn-finger/Zn-ribbon topoisomerase 1